MHPVSSHCLSPFFILRPSSAPLYLFTFSLLVRRYRDIQDQCPRVYQPQTASLSSMLYSYFSILSIAPCVEVVSQACEILNNMTGSTQASYQESSGFHSRLGPFGGGGGMSLNVSLYWRSNMGSALDVLLFWLYFIKCNTHSLCVYKKSLVF